MTASMREAKCVECKSGACSVADEERDDDEGEMKLERTATRR